MIGLVTKKKLTYNLSFFLLRRIKYIFIYNTSTYSWICLNNVNFNNQIQVHKKNYLPRGSNRFARSYLINI